VVVIAWYLDLHLPMYKAPINNDFLDPNIVHGEVYSIQHFLKCVSEICGRSVYFSPGTPITSTNKTTCHDIAELLLKVTLNFISLAYIYLQLHLIDVQ
jgi:hypothetical protein